MMELVPAGGLWSLVPIVLCVVAYSRFAHKLSSVAVPEEELEGGGEKTALLHTPAHNEEEGASHKSLVIWAAAVLPLDAAVCYLVCFGWVAASEGTIALWHYILLAYLAIGPVLGALAVLFYSLVLSHKNLETYHTLRRASMLDGVFLPPGLVVGAACTFPGVFAGAVWIGAGALYAAQAVVWARYFHASRRESLERADL